MSYGFYCYMVTDSYGYQFHMGSTITWLLVFHGYQCFMVTIVMVTSGSWLPLFHGYHHVMVSSVEDKELQGYHWHLVTDLVIGFSFCCKNKIQDTSAKICLW